jgi:toxin ParE1/3/4
MKVRWSETATSEVEEIFVYILGHSPASAEVVARRIIDRAESLANFPFLGTDIKRDGTRKLQVVNYPYVVLYKIDVVAGEIQILNVRHTARKKPAADDPRAG